jgi:glyoxylase-like metal-dependent hydrolase (beta-lactamase superfamily II)
MGLEIKALHIGDVGLDWSSMLLYYKPGRKTWIPCNSFLILGAKTPILVETGFGKPEIMDSRNMKGSETGEQNIVELLREQGVKPGDVGYIIYTHLHVDHCGKNPLFPNAKIVIQRREMASTVAGIHPYGYPYVPWFIGNLDRIEFLDGDFELFPGIKCVLSIGHTAGHQHVEVLTSHGKVIMCGDTIYDIPLQLEGKDPSRKVWLTGYYYHQELLVWEMYKLKKEYERGTLILPTHAYEVYDEYKLGKRIGDKRRDYEGFLSLEWPPK